MKSLTLPSTPLPGDSDRQPPPPRLRRRRSSRLLVLGVLLGVVGALLGWFAYNQATQQITVAALARSVPFGQPLSNLDVRPVFLPTGSDVSSIPWDEITGAVGRTAATDLYAGQVLPPEALRTEPVPVDGDAVIGIAVDAGQVPTTPLATRDEVLVVRPNDAGSTVRAVVLAVGAPDVSSRRTVDLLVPEGTVPALARAAGDEATLIVLVARR